MTPMDDDMDEGASNGKLRVNKGNWAAPVWASYTVAGICLDRREHYDTNG